MSLAPSDRQALAEIEQSLAAGDPKLAAKMATFAALPPGDTIARWKLLSPWRLRLRRTAMAVIALAIIGIFVFAMIRSGGHTGAVPNVSAR
jgi:hypothetical protein